MRITVESIGGAAVLTLLVVLYLYVKKGMPYMSDEVAAALAEIFKFWFRILWSVTFLATLFRSVKYFFNKCYNRYALRLYSCDAKERIEPIDYADIIKVWRRWFMLLIWIVAIIIVFGVATVRIFSIANSVFSWLGLPVLYLFTIVGGFFAIVLTTSMCKKIKVERC